MDSFKIIKVRRDIFDHMDDLTRLAAEILQQQGRLVVIEDKLATQKTI